MNISNASISVNPACARQPEQGLHVLRVGGLVPLTTTDYPGQLAAVVFCQGCAWQCGYCQNPHLIPNGQADRSWPETLAFLQRRQGLLDAVVFSGGEPTMQGGLGEAMQQVQGLGFRVGLHSAGVYPERLEKVLPLTDWVGLDIKAPFAAYERITHVPGSGARALASAKAVLASGTAHEFRTTVHPALLQPEDLLTLAQELAEMGVRNYVVQEFRPAGCADAMLCDSTTYGFLKDDLLAEIGARFECFSVRRA